MALCLCLNLKNRCLKYILNFNKDKMMQTHSSAGIAQNPLLAAVQLRENDVFNFRYKPDEAKKRFEPYGTLVVKKYGEDKLYLVDTYWGSGDSRTFTPDE